MTVKFRGTYMILALALLALGCEQSTPVGLRAVRLDETAGVALDTIYGPEQLARTAGGPDTFVRVIATGQFEAPFVLHVRNGAPDGSARVSSLSVTLDGVTVFGPSDFSQSVPERAVSVDPAAQALLAVRLASKPGAHVTVWLEGHRRGIRVCPGTTAAGEFVALADAVAAAPDGATILLCDGTHHASHVALGDKAVTIAPEGPGTPTLDGDGADEILGIVNSDAHVMPAITIRGLRFVNAAHRAVSVGEHFGSVVIEQSEFHPHQTAPYGSPPGFDAGIQVVSDAGQTVVRDNTFLGGDVGVHVLHTPGVLVAHNHSDGQVESGVHVAFSPGARIDGNDFTNCGVDQCLAVDDSRGAAITGNQVVVLYARRTDNPIRINAWPAGGDYVVTDNTITGVGNGGTGDRTDPMTYPIHVAGIQVAAGSATISRNSVTNARAGINFTPVPHATGSDNVFTHVLAPFLGGSAPGVTDTVTFSRNDIVDYVKPTDFGGFGVADLRCNWWGAASGPHDAGGMLPPTFLFSPWATQPIAGRPGVLCP